MPLASTGFDVPAMARRANNRTRTWVSEKNFIVVRAFVKDAVDAVVTDLFYNNDCPNLFKVANSVFIIL